MRPTPPEFRPREEEVEDGKSFSFRNVFRPIEDVEEDDGGRAVYGASITPPAAQEEEPDVTA